jgi:hypothetical protein
MHGGKTPNSWEHCFIVCFVSRLRDPAGSLYVVEWSGTPKVSLLGHGYYSESSPQSFLVYHVKIGQQRARSKNLENREWSIFFKWYLCPV